MNKCKCVLGLCAKQTKVIRGEGEPSIPEEEEGEGARMCDVCVGRSSTPIKSMSPK